jgi:hypothetical protein
MGMNWYGIQWSLREDSAVLFKGVAGADRSDKLQQFRHCMGTHGHAAAFKLEKLQVQPPSLLDRRDNEGNLELALCDELSNAITSAMLVNQLRGATQDAGCPSGDGIDTDVSESGTFLRSLDVVAAWHAVSEDVREVLLDFRTGQQRPAGTRRFAKADHSVTADEGFLRQHWSMAKR